MLVFGCLLCENPPDVDFLNGSIKNLNKLLNLQFFLNIIKILTT